jgi:hypothetical protein
MFYINNFDLFNRLPGNPAKLPVTIVVVVVWLLNTPVPPSAHP